MCETLLSSYLRQLLKKKKRKKENYFYDSCLVQTNLSKNQPWLPQIQILAIIRPDRKFSLAADLTRLRQPLGFLTGAYHV